MSFDEFRAIRSAQLNRLIKANFRTVFTGSFLVVLVAFVQQRVVDSHLLGLWLSISLAINIARVWMCHYFQKHPAQDIRTIGARLNWFRLGVALSAVMWGINPFFVFGHQHVDQELFIVYVIVGMTAGSIVTYTIDRATAMAYLIFTITPTLLNMFTLDSAIYSTMAYAGLFYTAFNFYTVTLFNRDLIEGIRLRHEADTRDAEIKKIAFNDVLTGLPNRRKFQEKLEHALNMRKRTGHGGALLFIDVDRFKELNDTHGHDAGDMLLSQVAQRLSANMRETDTVSRFGGDEFVVMLENLSKDMQEAVTETERIADQVMQILTKPYMLGKMEYRITVSIGVSVFGKHGYTYEELLKNADVAMYQAKRAGRNATVFFDAEMISGSYS